MRANQRIVRVLNQNLQKNPIEKRRKREVRSIGEDQVLPDLLSRVQEVVLVPALQEEEGRDVRIVTNVEEKTEKDIIAIEKTIEEEIEIIIERDDMNVGIENMEVDQERDHHILY